MLIISTAWNLFCDVDSVQRVTAVTQRCGSASAGRGAHTAPDHSALLFRGAAPHAGVLVGGQRELEAGISAHAAEADLFGGGNLIDRVPGGTYREEQCRIGVSACRLVLPLGCSLKSISG